MNGLKHGMTARVIVLPHEDSVEYHEIRAGLIESYAPANAHETMLVDQIAAGDWRTLRARRFDTALLTAGARPRRQCPKMGMGPIRRMVMKAGRPQPRRSELSILQKT